MNERSYSPFLMKGPRALCTNLNSYKCVVVKGVTIHKIQKFQTCSSTCFLVVWGGGGPTWGYLFIYLFVFIFKIWNMIFKMIMRQFLLFHNNYNFNFFGGSCSTSRWQNDEVEWKILLIPWKQFFLKFGWLCYYLEEEGPQVDGIP